MAVRISELDELSVDLSQLDELPIVDLSAGDTKKITVANLLNVGISGAPSSFIDLGKLNQSSTTKLGAVALDNTGVASGTYGGAATVAQFIVNPQGLITSASGVAIVIAASGVTGLSAVATSGTYASLSGLPTLGTLSSQDAGSVVISGGTISGVTFISGNVTISGGTISGITDLALADGGTGASTAADARTNLGLVIRMFYRRHKAALSFQAAPFQVSLILHLAIADGGTGASSAADARTNLGLVIGTDIQAYDAGLASIAGLTTSADEILYLTGADTYASSPLPSYARDFLASGNSDSDARTVLGLGALATKALVEPGDIDAGAVSGATIASGSLISDNYGAGSVLEAAIGASAVTTGKIVDSGITAIKLADNSASIVGTGAPITAGVFIGQQYLDGVTDFAYTWDGDSWERHSAISSIDFVDSTPIAFAVTYPDNYSATITTTVEDQTAATIFAGPVSGIATAPTFRALASSDLPLAAAGTVGAVQPGAGLAVDGDGAINHANAAIAGTYAGAVTIDSEGHVVTAEAALAAEDIPSLDASKIDSGTFGQERLSENSVGAEQLRDNGIAQVSESAPEAQFAGQWWINPNDRSAYIWVGTVSPGGNNGYWLNLGYGSPTQINLRFGGTYNASGNTVASINNYGIEAGLTIGQGLSSPNTSNNGVYLIVTASGTGTAPAPTEPLSIGNWVLSEGVGTSWTKVSLSSAVAGVSDQDVLVEGASLVPAASGIASQEDFNESVWPKVQIANSTTAGIVRASTEVVVASGTGIMSIGTIDDGTYA
jgi:hypothetical protein